MNQEIVDLQEKLHAFQEQFSDDEEVQSLILKLRNRFNQLQDKHFSDDVYETQSFNEMNEGYWSQCRESDVDELDIFTFFWFN